MHLNLIHRSVLKVLKTYTPSRRFRPDGEDSVVGLEGELMALLRLANEKANKGGIGRSVEQSSEGERGVN